MTQGDEGYRQRSRAESEVVHAVWDELGGELVEEFVVPTVPGDGGRAREIDGVIVAGKRYWHRAYDVDNPVLRELLAVFPEVSLPRRP